MNFLPRKVNKWISALIVLCVVVAVYSIYPKTADAAIAVDATSAGVSNSFAASPTLTWSHVTVSGATLMVVTCMTWQDVAGSGTVASASYNSSALTSVNSTAGGAMYSWIGYIVNPASGTHSVSVVITGNIDAVKCGAVTFTGTTTSSPVDTSTITSGSTTSITNSITTANANEVIVASVSHFGTQAMTIGGSQTAVYNDVTGSTGGAGGYRVVTTATSYSPAWTTTGSNDWSITIAAFKPAAAAATGSGAMLPFND